MTLTRSELEARVAFLDSQLNSRSKDEDTFKYILDNSPNLVFISQHGRVVYANRHCYEMVGYTVEEIAHPDFDFLVLIAPESLAKVKSALARHMRGEEIEQYEYVIVGRDGERIEAINATRLIEYRGEPAILGIATDVSALKSLERELKESENRYRTLVQTCPDAIVATDLKGNLLAANHAAASLRGFPSVEALLASPEGATAFEGIVPEQRARANEVLLNMRQSKRVERFEYDIVRVDGSIVATELLTSTMRNSQGDPLGFVGVLRDLTERKAAEAERMRLQAELEHAQRLESLGLLAGGVAHDFNNLLVGMMGNASLALAELPTTSRARKYVEQVITAAEKAAELTGQMLAYSGKAIFSTGPLRLGDVVMELRGLLDAAVPKGVEIQFAVEDSADIEGDPSQIQQVVINLIINAAEAMPNGGVVRVMTGCVAGSEIDANAICVGEAEEGRIYQCLSVIDRGCGLDEQTRQRMFDPFFSTKFTGRGLGLAAVLGIVRGHRGLLTVESKEGWGTTFRVLFPATTMPRDVETTEAPGHVSPPQDGATVLVVDDEEIVRALIEQALSSLGFEVRCACDGEEGVRMVEEGGVDLVIMDMTMPRMGGVKAFNRICEIDAKLPVILSSGYTEREAKRLTNLDGLAGFIQKPYKPAQLIRMVCQALEKRSRD